MPVPLGKKDRPTNDSIVDDLPALWLPNTTIWGRESRASVAPSVAASCWSRASVSTTAPSTTRVGCWGVVMVGGLCAAVSGPTTGLVSSGEFRLALVFADRVRRLAAVAKNGCVVLAASDAQGSAHAVSAEQMPGQAAKNGALATLGVEARRLRIEEARDRSACPCSFTQNGFLVSYKPLASSGSAACDLA